MTATGWAAIANGSISVRSVSDTRRGAMVNFLATDRRVMTPDWMTDDQIETVWQQQRGTADIIQVIISKIEN